MSARCKDIIDIIEKMAPSCLCMDHDNVGLIVGGEDSVVDSVLIALDINDSVINEAIDNCCSLIITHHPVIFSPVKLINTGDFKGRQLHRLISNNINVYAAHTNLDAADGGINDYLAKLFGLTDISVIGRVYTDTERKYGFGRVGYLTAPKSLKELSIEIKSILGIDKINMVGDPDCIIKKVGLCSGDGTDFIREAKECGCDAYITGDIRYHDACDARDMGIALIDGGHFATENIYMPQLKNILECAADKNNIDVGFILSSVNKSPFIQV